MMLIQVVVAQAPELGQGWLPEFNLASPQISTLSEATPTDKFSWRPAPGVRSVSEVYRHVALGNYGLPGQAGVTVHVDASKLPPNPGTNITAKADVLK